MGVGGVGNLNCLVVSSNSSTILCRNDEASTTSGKAVNLIVFLKVSEEAPCLGSCLFTFTDQVPTVSTLQANWNSSSYSYQIDLTGQNFDLGSS